MARDFAAAGPDRLWVADITYIPTWAGFLYLAVVVDAGSRRVIGWAMASHPRTARVLAALDMAVEQRQSVDVIHHSDHGCPFTSIAFGLRCREAGVRPSIGSVGDAYDNALCERFFATLECELLDRQRFAKPAEARLAQSASAAFCTRLSVAHDVRAVARNRRSPSDLRIDDRPAGCYLGIPLGAGAATISKAVHPPPNRGNSTT